MPKGNHLSQEEQRSILELKRAGLNNSEIARQLQRSESVVRSFLKKPLGYYNQRPKRVRRKLSEAAKRNLIREASKGKLSSKGLISAQNLPIGKSRVCKILNESGRLKYTKRKRTPALTREHKERRLEFAYFHFNREDTWTRTIFTDEKKFNLDGPDGCQYYWHDLRKEKESFFSRQQGGASVMVWAGFSMLGKTHIAVLEGSQDAVAYCTTLRNYLLPFARRTHPRGFVFQQDNARIHTARVTTEFLDGHMVNRLAWPALSPDLNPIENLWGILVRAVYEGGRQYESKEALIEAIEREWAKIPQNVLQNLVNSMNERCKQVIVAKGAKTKY
jgi:transposase